MSETNERQSDLNWCEFDYKHVHFWHQIGISYIKDEKLFMGHMERLYNILQCTQCKKCKVVKLQFVDGGLPELE